jgi:hypothetical protein
MVIRNQQIDLHIIPSEATRIVSETNLAPYDRATVNAASPLDAAFRAAESVGKI